MFDARQRKSEGHGWGVERRWRCPSAQGRPRALLGAFLGVVLLALPLAAEEAAKTEPEAGLKARGQAFWKARITEGSAGQDAWLEPKVRRQMRLTPAMQAPGPLQGPEGAGGS
jgi:hypothetical protein